MTSNKCFVDTSVLVDSLIKEGEARVRAHAALSRYQDRQICVYALKEFKAGVLRYHFWLWTKLTDLNSFSAALGAIRGVFRQPYRQASAIEAYESLVRYVLSLNLPVDPNSDILLQRDALAARLAAIELKRKIVVAWRDRLKHGRQVETLDCYSNEELVYDNSSLRFGVAVCDRGERCCAARHLLNDRSTLTAVIATLRNASPKRENKKRREVLKRILRHGHEIDDDECRSIGDAYFVVRCPDDCDILTTNLVDMKVLASANGRSVVSP